MMTGYWNPTGRQRARHDRLAPVLTQHRHHDLERAALPGQVRPQCVHAYE